MTSIPLPDNLLQKATETYSSDKNTIKPILKQNVILTSSYVIYNFLRYFSVKSTKNKKTAPQNCSKEDWISGIRNYDHNCLFNID